MFVLFDLTHQVKRGAEGVVSRSSGMTSRAGKSRRRGSAHRGTPPSPPHKVSGALIPGGEGLRPAGLSEGEHSPRSDAASRTLEASRPTFAVTPILDRA